MQFCMNFFLLFPVVLVLVNNLLKDWVTCYLMTSSYHYYDPNWIPCIHLINKQREERELFSMSAEYYLKRLGSCLMIGVAFSDTFLT